MAGAITDAPAAAAGPVARGTLAINLRGDLPPSYAGISFQDGVLGMETRNAWPQSWGPQAGPGFMHGRPTSLDAADTSAAARAAVGAAADVYLPRPSSLRWGPEFPILSLKPEDTPGMHAAGTESESHPLAPAVFTVEGRVILDGSGRMLRDDAVTADQVAGLRDDLGGADDRLAIKASGKLFLLMLEDGNRSHVALVAGADAGAGMIRAGLALMRRVTPCADSDDAVASAEAKAAWKTAMAVPIMLCRHGGPEVLACYSAGSFLADAGFTLEEALAGVALPDRHCAAYYFGVLSFFAYQAAGRAALLDPESRPLFGRMARILLRVALTPADTDPHMRYDDSWALWLLCNLPRACDIRQRRTLYEIMGEELDAAVAERAAAGDSERAIAERSAERQLPTAVQLPGAVRCDSEAERDTEGDAEPTAIKASIGDSSSRNMGVLDRALLDERRSLGSRDASTPGERRTSLGGGIQPPLLIEPSRLTDPATLAITLAGRCDFPTMRRGWALNFLEDCILIPPDVDPAECPQAAAVERALFDYSGRTGIISLVREASPWSLRAPMRVLIAAARAAAAQAAHGIDAPARAAGAALLASLMGEMLALLALPSDSATPALAASEVLAETAHLLPPEQADRCVDELLRLLASCEQLEQRFGMPIISEEASSLRVQAHGWHASRPLFNFARLAAHRQPILEALTQQIRSGPRDGSLHAAATLYRIAATSLPLGTSGDFLGHIAPLAAVLNRPTRNWEATGLVLGALLTLSQNPSIVHVMVKESVATFAYRVAAQAPPGLEWAKTTAIALASALPNVLPPPNPRAGHAPTGLSAQRSMDGIAVGPPGVVHARDPDVGLVSMREGRRRQWSGSRPGAAGKPPPGEAIGTPIFVADASAPQAQVVEPPTAAPDAHVIKSKPHAQPACCAVM